LGPGSEQLEQKVAGGTIGDIGGAIVGGAIGANPSLGPWGLSEWSGRSLLRHSIAAVGNTLLLEPWWWESLEPWLVRPEPKAVHNGSCG
jgi:hypothetical protein